MTNKTPIDDEMVERACVVSYAEDRLPGQSADWNKVDESSKRIWRKTIRAGLDAALNPPSVPEIEVTEAMLHAASKLRIYMSVRDINCVVALNKSNFCDIYRAMAAAAPKDVKCEKNKVSAEGYSYSYGIGLVPNRTDGLIALHVGSESIQLSGDEAMKMIGQLRRLIPDEVALNGYWSHHRHTDRKPIIPTSGCGHRRKDDK